MSEFGKLLELEEELFDELETEEDFELEVSDFLKLIVKFWFFVIFTLQVYEPSLFFETSSLQPFIFVPDNTYPLLGVAFKVTVPFFL